MVDTRKERVGISREVLALPADLVELKDHAKCLGNGLRDRPEGLGDNAASIFYAQDKGLIRGRHLVQVALQVVGLLRSHILSEAALIHLLGVLRNAFGSLRVEHVGGADGIATEDLRECCAALFLCQPTKTLLKLTSKVLDPHEVAL